ncbi:MAG: class I tRNA ligase family protein [Chloroflexota bacterium]
MADNTLPFDLAEMAKAYDPQAFELPIYEWWESKGLFKPEIAPDDAEPFVISIPPPNVTGELHRRNACLEHWPTDAPSGLFPQLSVTGMHKKFLERPGRPECGRRRAFNERSEFLAKGEKKRLVLACRRLPDFSAVAI